jgi:hypothetical protein
VVVSDANGTSSSGPSFTYLPPPAVASVTPAHGPSAGATPVVIKGTGFLPGATVQIGSAATSVEVVSETEITAVTAASSPGSHEVVVSDAHGTSSGGPSFAYEAPPAVAGVTPAEGPSGGGTPVVVKGSGFVPGSTVTIGAATLSVHVVSSTEITATTAAGTPGADEVVVSNVNGTSSGAPSFTYLPPPSVASVSPTEGSTAGGTAVVIKGSGFVPGATVQIGSEAKSVHVVSPSEITAVTSATPAGAREVVVTDADGTSSGGPSFTYVVPPPPPIIVTTPFILLPSSGLLGDQTNVPPPGATFGTSGNIAPVSGHVRIKLPGSSTWVDLTGLRNVPFGVIVDATEGKVTVTTVGPSGAPQTITYYEGEFLLAQRPSGQVVATLAGGSFSGCPTKRKHKRRHGAHSSASKRHTVRATPPRATTRPEPCSGRSG